MTSTPLTCSPAWYAYQLDSAQLPYKLLLIQNITDGKYYLVKSSTDLTTVSDLDALGGGSFSAIEYSAAAAYIVVSVGPPELRAPEQNGAPGNATLSYPGTGSAAPFLELGMLGLRVAALDEDDMISDSDTKLATQQSIKAYVDSQLLSLANGAVQSAYRFFKWDDGDGQFAFDRGLMFPKVVVLRGCVRITTAFDGTTPTITVGKNPLGSDEYLQSDDTDLTVEDKYVSDIGIYESAAETLYLDLVTDGSTVGEGMCVIEWVSTPTGA